MSKLLLFYRKIIGLRHYSVNLDYIRTPFGEPFNQDNHWVKTLEEYDYGLRDYKKSTLYNFHQGFQPTNIFSLINDNDIFKNNFFLGEYPWGRWAQKTKREDWEKGSHCGPTTDENIKKEWDNFIYLYNKMQAEGLKLKKYGLPLGCFLIDENKEKYFIVTGGNHRMAIISHLKLSQNIAVRAIARENIKQFTYFDRIKIKHYRSGLDMQKTKRLFKYLISTEFTTYEN